MGFAHIYATQPPFCCWRFCCAKDTLQWERSRWVRITHGCIITCQKYTISTLMYSFQWILCKLEYCITTSGEMQILSDCLSSPLLSPMLLIFHFPPPQVLLKCACHNQSCQKLASSSRGQFALQAGYIKHRAKDMMSFIITYIHLSASLTWFASC